MTSQPQEEDFETLLAYIKRDRGFDFGGYKRPSLMRRVRRRMESLHVDTFGGYLDFLQAHDNEFNELFNTILINVTAFFRDSDSWDYIRDEVVPKIVDRKERGHRFESGRPVAQAVRRPTRSRWSSVRCSASEASASA